MGAGESTTRKVSFGVDDEERVRILRGVKLSEDVLQRMKGVANIAPERKPPTSSNIQKETGPSNPRPQANPPNRAQPKPQSTTNPTSNSKPTSYAKEEQKKFERQQTKLKEDLARASQKDSDAAKEDMIKALSRERHNKRQETERTKQLSADEVEAMAQKLQKKDSQLKALDAFYKEQLALLEKRNLEKYEQSKEQFHQAASEAEVNVGHRNTLPVCAGVQAQILSCYRANRDQTLKCSDLAKEYMKCIDAAKKSLLVNHV